MIWFDPVIEVNLKISLPVTGLWLYIESPFAEMGALLMP